MTDDYADYCCEYPFDGAKWSFTIRARSHEEAEARLKQMPWAKVKGRLEIIIPASSPGAGLFVRLYCWVRNTLKTRE